MNRCPPAQVRAALPRRRGGPPGGELLLPEGRAAPRGVRAEEGPRDSRRIPFLFFDLSMGMVSYFRFFPDPSIIGRFAGFVRLEHIRVR